MNEKENDKALSHIEKALQIDISNSNAIRYFKMLKGNFSASISRTIDRRPATINIKRKSYFKSYSTQKGQILDF